jgi:hypothetical protein
MSHPDPTKIYVGDEDGVGECIECNFMSDELNCERKCKECREYKKEDLLKAIKEFEKGGWHITDINKCRKFVNEVKRFIE